MRLAQRPFDDLRLGRYPSILLSLLALSIFGFGTAFVSSFHQYLVFRFGVSQALVGYSISSVSLGEAGPRGAGRAAGGGASWGGAGCWGRGAGG